MKVDQGTIENTLNNLCVLCERQRNKQISYSEFERSYSENLNFLKTIDFPSPINKLFDSLPEFSKPSILTEDLEGEYFIFFGTIAPFIVTLLIVLIAPIGIPLMIWNIFTKKRIKSNVEHCIQTLSSLRFLLERPSLYQKEIKKDKLGLI